MASSDFLRNNPRYRSAGDWRYDSRRNQIDGRPREKKPAPGSNLDVFHLRNKQGLSADEATEAATDLRASGLRTGFGGEGLEPNRMLSSRERVRMGLDKSRPSAPTRPTGDQRKWAKVFRESSTRPPLRSAAGPEKPLNFSRSALVEGAKSSGDFANIRKGFNTQSAAAQTGMRMNERGVAEPLSKTKVGADGLTPFAREKFGSAVADKAAARDFATNKSTTTSGTTGMVKQEGGARPTQAMDFSRTITSKYGTGTNVSRAPGQQGGGMMPDPLTGKMVPMKNALAEQSAVQDTKFGPNAGKAGEGYFDPKAIRQSMQQKRGRVA